jgi:hypothetical protein
MVCGGNLGSSLTPGEEIPMPASYIAEALRNETLDLGGVQFHLRWRELGKLVLPTGQIVACDPIFVYEPDPFVQTVSSGCYPVSLRLAQMEGTRHERVAFAMIQIQEEESAGWKLARRSGQIDGSSEDAEQHRYGVDAGLGCFMDLAAARAMEQRYAEDDTFHDVIYEAVEDSYPGCANLILEKDTGLNVAVFSTGIGDGAYASYWGCSSSGDAVCLLTDFDLFTQKTIAWLQKWCVDAGS